MPDYTNLSSMFQGAPGILGGAMAGLRIPYEMQGADNTLKAQGIQNMSELEKLRMLKESTNPMQEAQNSLVKNQAEAQNNPDLIKSVVDASLSENNAKGVEAEGRIQARQQLFAADLGQEIAQRAQDNGGKPFDPMKQADRDWWEDKRKDAKKLRVPFPEFPDFQPDGSSKTLQMMAAKGASIYNDPKLYAQLKVTALQGSNQLANTALHNKGLVDVANIVDTGRQNVAEANNASKEAIAAGRQAATQANGKMINIIAAMIKKGDPVPEELLNMAADQAYRDEAKDTGLGIASLVAYNAGDIEKGDALKQKWIENWKKTTFKKESSKPTEGGKTTKSSLATTVGKPGETKDTEDGTYEWDAARGGWARKK